MRSVWVVAWAALALAPAAAAWGTVGTWEPSTPQDVADGYMWLDAPPAGEERVYFDAFPSPDDMVVNPNAGALGGSALPPGPTTFRAFFGVWQDCNLDGYVGLREGAVQDYRAELLPPDSPCPRGGWHNDGQWVSEMLTVGMVDACEKQDAAYRERYCPGVGAFFGNTRVVYVDRARVWGDVGLPQDAVARCPSAPLPRGSTSRAGTLLAVADCQDGYAVRGRLDATSPALGDALDAPLPASLLGDPAAGRAGLLERGSGDPAFVAWDCSTPKGGADVRDPLGLNAVGVADPTGGALSGKQVLPVVGTTEPFRDEDGDPATPGVFRPAPDDADGSLVWAPAFAPSLRDPTGSWWDAAELAADGPRGDCDPSTTNAVGARDPSGAVEGPDAAGGPSAKTRNGFVFAFYDGYRGWNPSVDPYVGANAPTDLGVVATRDTHGGPMWSAGQFDVQRPRAVRADDLAPEGPQRFTFYASSDLVGLPLPHAGSGVYGTEACEGAIGPGAPDANGWSCDPDAWWLDGGGHDVAPRYSDGYALAARPGDEYQLRDVDCYDGRAASAQPLPPGFACP